ncbi:MAG: STAS domain-containing protein [Acidobacteria bacterium]|nr:STAS domain-containing protein [Acidobacteriota bacterium]
MSSVAVTAQGGVVVLAVQGRLDATAGAALLAAIGQAVVGGIPRVDIDLRPVTSFTAAGADALATCRTAAADLIDGLHYCTGPGPGQDALLTAYA